jgi:hypothetical protein
LALEETCRASVERAEVATFGVLSQARDDGFVVQQFVRDRAIEGQRVKKIVQGEAKAQQRRQTAVLPIIVISDCSYTWNRTDVWIIIKKRRHHNLYDICVL